MRRAKQPKRTKRWTAKRPIRSRLGNFGLGLAGLGVAAISSYFPYYVYNNANEFGPPKMVFTGRLTLADEVSVEEDDWPVILVRREPLFQDARQGANPIVTGSVRKTSPASQKGQARVLPRRELPRSTTDNNPQTDLQLVFATRGRALIRDGYDLLPVAVGSRLPDGSIVRSVTKPNNRWRLLTSTNLILELSN